MAPYYVDDFESSLYVSLLPCQFFVLIGTRRSGFNPELMRIVQESDAVTNVMREYFGIGEDEDTDSTDANANPATDASPDDAPQESSPFNSPLLTPSATPEGASRNMIPTDTSFPGTKAPASEPQYMQ